MNVVLEKYRQFLKFKSNKQLDLIMLTNMLPSSSKTSKKIKSILLSVENNETKLAQIQKTLQQIEIKKQYEQELSEMEIEQVSPSEDQEDSKEYMGTTFDIDRWKMITNQYLKQIEHFSRENGGKPTIKVYSNELRYLNQSKKSRFVNIEAPNSILGSFVNENSIHTQSKELLNNIWEYEKKTNEKKQISCQQFIQTDLKLSKALLKNLTALNIKTELLYPKHAFKKDHENSWQNMFSQFDAESQQQANRYIKKLYETQEDKPLPSIIYQLPLETISRAILYFGATKQSQFLKSDSVFKKIDATIKQEHSYIFYKDISQNQQIYLPYIIDSGFSNACLIGEKALQQSDNKFNGMNNLNFCLKLLRKIFANLKNYGLGLAQDQDREHNIDRLNRLSLITCQRWLEGKFSIKATNLYTLIQVMEGMNDISELMELIKNELKVEVAQMKYAYDSILEQTLDQIKYIFEQSTIFNSIDNQMLSKILELFKNMYKKTQIPIQFISPCFLSLSTLKYLPLQCRRSLLSLLARKQTLELTVDFNFVKRIMKNIVGLNSQQLLMAIQVMSHYQFEENQLMLLLNNNLERDKIEPKTKELLINLVSTKLNNENVKQKMLSFIKGSPLSGNLI